MRAFLNYRKRNLAASLALALAAAGCGASPQVYVAKGHQALDERRFEEAEIDFQKAIQKSPQMGDAWYGLGLTEFRAGKLNEAFRDLTRATELLPSNQEAQVALADVCLAGYIADSNRPGPLYEKVLATAGQLLQRDPNSFDGLRLKGYIAMLDRRYPEAIGLLQRADAAKPGQPEVNHVLVECLIGNQQGPEAEKLALAGIAAHKEYAPVYDVLYGYYMQNNRAADAGELLKTKIRHNPDVIDYQLQLARHYLSANQPAEMSALLGQVMDDTRHFPEGRMAVGNFYAGIDRPQDALRIFQAGAAQDAKRKIAYQQKTAETLDQLGKPEEALAVIQEILKAEPKNADARALRASIYLDGHDSAKYDIAYADLDQLLKEKPADAMLHYDMGRAQLDRGNTESALTEFQKSIEANHGFILPRILAANIALGRQDYKQAARYADELLALTDNNPTARMLRIDSLTGMGNFEQATAEISRLDKDYPNALEPKLQLAALRLAQGKYAEADSIYRSLYQAHRDDPRPLQGLLDTYYAQNQYDAAVQFLTKEKQKSPSPQIDAMLADAALRGHRLDLAVQQYTQLANANPQVPFEHLRLGDAYLQKGDYAQAIAQFQTAKSLTPKDPLTVAMLALALHDAGRVQDAEQSYREALSLQSENPLVMNNLAYLMAENGGNVDEALRLAQSASREQPTNVAISDTVGWIFLKKNQPDSAIQVLTNVVQKSPRRALYRYHLAMALFQKGDKAGAREQLRTALSSSPSKTDEEKIRALLSRLG